jgi:hypothetical protein
LLAVLDGIFRIPFSSPAPCNSLTNMDVHQVRATEFCHVTRFLSCDRQQPR